MRKWVVGKERKGSREGEEGGIIAWDLQEIHPSSGKKTIFTKRNIYFPHLLYQKCAEN